MGRAGKQVRKRIIKKEGATLDRTQRKTARTLDQLAVFDDFNSRIMPELRKCITEKWPNEKIRKHFMPMIQTMVVERALRGDFKAMKDILDRHEGLPVQRVQQNTVIASMSKQELAALALQRLKDAGLLDAVEAGYSRVEDAKLTDEEAE